MLKERCVSMLGQVTSEILHAYPPVFYWEAQLPHSCLQKGTREKGDSLALWGKEHFSLLAREALLEAILAPVNNIEMSWGRWCWLWELAGYWKAGALEAWPSISLGFICIRIGVWDSMWVQVHPHTLLILVHVLWGCYVAVEWAILRVAAPWIFLKFMN